MAVAGGPYVAFSDDDSWWAPGALGVAADLFDAHPRRAVADAVRDLRWIWHERLPVDRPLENELCRL